MINVEGALLSCASEATACAAEWAYVTVTHPGTGRDLCKARAVQAGGERGVPHLASYRHVGPTLGTVAWLTSAEYWWAALSRVHHWLCVMM